MAVLKDLSEILVDEAREPASPWRCKALINGENITYAAWRTDSNAGLIVDPVREDHELTNSFARSQASVCWCVLDTHTHADHASGAVDLARSLNVPLIMQRLAPSQRVDIRICKDTFYPFGGELMKFMLTPGHTPDSLSVLWGAVLFYRRHHPIH